MRLPNWFRIAWWALLIFSLLFLLHSRLTAITSGLANGIDAFFFLILIILLLLPLFQEFDFFGIKLKSKIEELKSDVKEQITNLRSDMQTIGINTQVSPQIYLTPPPSDNQLPQIEERFRKILKETLFTFDIKSSVDIQNELLIPNDVNYLFVVRYTIEKELKRIWQERFQKEGGLRFTPINKITQALYESKLLDKNLSNVIRDIYAICSPAIHGDDVSKNQIKFVEDIAPDLITALMAIK